VTRLAFEKFRLAKLQVPPDKPKSTKGFPFEFKLGRRMVHELRSSIEGSRDPTTHISTPKFVEEVNVEVMKAYLTVELFQTMAIVSLNMGNLTLEIDTLKNILAIGEKEKVVLQEELDKEKYFQKGYKNNLEIWRKNKVEAEQKNKVLIKKLQDENEKLRGNTTWLKS
jgi:hypothetical protein